MPEKIPATVITGFLGAGKTTLIRNLLARAGGRRIALIVNEFGDIGIDGEMLAAAGGDGTRPEEDIIELSNGCICCTVADDFAPTLEMLVGRADPPEHIVIETSGLALPQPLVRTFNWPRIRNRITVDGVVTVVDGPATAAGQFAHDLAAIEAQRTTDAGFDHDTPLAQLFEDQMTCADMVVVSKTDTMAGEAVTALLDGLQAKAREGVRLVRSSTEGLSPEVLLGLGVGAEGHMDARHEIHHHHHHDGHHHHDHAQNDHGQHDHGHDAFQSFALTLGEVPDGPAFAQQVAEIIRTHAILRLKGFIAVKAKPMRMVIQAVGPRIETYFDRPFGTAPRETRLVVIGQHGLDEAVIRAAIREAIHEAIHTALT